MKKIDQAGFLALYKQYYFSSSYGSITPARFWDQKLYDCGPAPHFNKFESINVKFNLYNLLIEHNYTPDLSGLDLSNCLSFRNVDFKNINLACCDMSKMQHFIC